MTAKVLKIKAAGGWEFAEVEVDAGGEIPLEAIQDCVGGWIELAPVFPGFPTGVDVYINEEGKLQGLPYNDAATRLTRIMEMGDLIVGDAFVCGHDRTGRTVGLSKEQENLLRERL